MKKVEVELKVEKDVEEMSNTEFAEHLAENIAELNFDRCDSVRYNGYPIYNIDKDDMNYLKWHNALLLNKLPFCNFNGNAIIVKSKGNRRKFMNVVKLVINHNESFEINEKEI